MENKNSKFELFGQIKIYNIFILSFRRGWGVPISPFEMLPEAVALGEQFVKFCNSIKLVL